MKNFWSVFQILDEAFCVLHYLGRCVKKKEQPEDAQDLLKDIRDYSRWAFLLMRETVILIY